MRLTTKLGMRSLSIGGGGFLLGCLVGAALTLAGTALAQIEESDPEFVQALLYAIGELAIDSEKNAISIVALRERLDDLELRVEEMAPAKQQN